MENVFYPLVLKPVGAIYYNQSITGFFARLGLPSGVLIVSRIIIFVISIIASFKYRKNIFLSICVILTMVLLINSFTWQHHLILLLIPFYFLLSKNLKKRELILITISYFLISVNIKSPEIFLKTWYGGIVISHGFLGALILWLMLIFSRK